MVGVNPIGLILIAHCEIKVTVPIDIPPGDFVSAISLRGEPSLGQACPIALIESVGMPNAAHNEVQATVQVPVTPRQRVGKVSLG